MSTTWFFLCLIKNGLPRQYVDHTEQKAPPRHHWKLKGKTCARHLCSHPAVSGQQPTNSKGTGRCDDGQPESLLKALVLADGQGGHAKPEHNTLRKNCVLVVTLKWDSGPKNILGFQET